MLRTGLRPEATALDGGGVRLESPRDVDFALSALLGGAWRDAAPGDGARADILGRLRRSPTVADLVDAVIAWRRQRVPCAEEVEKAEEEARRRHALRLLCAYFLLDPPFPGEVGPEAPAS